MPIYQLAYTLGPSAYFFVHGGGDPISIQFSHLSRGGCVQEASSCTEASSIRLRRFGGFDEESVESLHFA